MRVGWFGLVGAVKLWLQVLLPSVDFAMRAVLIFMPFSLGPLMKLTYTAPSGPTRGVASWSNWWPASLTRMGPVQEPPLSSEYARSMGERPRPLNSAQAMYRRPKWWPGPVPGSTVPASWAGDLPFEPFWEPFDFPIVMGAGAVHAGAPPTAVP